ncbi:MAG: TetR/AcrR family transcriptional regulator [Lachnospiraceae bacterium]|nr:TetR/AcrR family transcriptional regulator [Lachnospiraceae bacterium]
MARKESISRDGILDVAFAMMKEEGIISVTARKLAAKANCSTQPIFRVFKSLEEMEQAIFLKAVTYFEDFYLAFAQRSNIPFVNLGMAYIRFALDNKNIFSLLFISDKRHGRTLYDLINGESGAVSKEISKAKAAGIKDASDLFMKMWMVIHGSACMSLTGDYDLSENDTQKLLEESYKAFS